MVTDYSNIRKGDTLLKFIEFTQDYIDNLRQSIVGEINRYKEAVVSNSYLLKQLQDVNTQLATENENLKNQLSKVQLVVAVNSTTTIDTTSSATTTV